MQPQRRIPSLDGLRGIAVGLVVLFHYGYGLEGIPIIGFVANSGWAGVDLFFVMSGFLIGSIVIANRETANLFSVFYVRRFLRIFPLYYLLLGIVAISIWLHWMPPSSRGLAVYFLYMQNLIGDLSDPGPYWLQATWSLAVEEHFYLLLPIVVVFTPIKSLKYMLFFGIAIAFLLRFGAYQLSAHPEQYALFFTACRGDGLLYGVLLAWLEKHWKIHFLLDRQLLAFLYVVLAVSAATFWYASHSSVQSPVFAVALTALGPMFFAVVSLALHDRGPIAWVTRTAVLRWTGIRTYAIYLVHLPALASVESLFDVTGLSHRGMIRPVALVITLGFAATSWFLIERPLITLGHAMKYRRASSLSVQAA
jgi:peptidoglycan/LPS O-acetylase OafA/YrhL